MSDFCCVIDYPVPVNFFCSSTVPLMQAALFLLLLLASGIPFYNVEQVIAVAITNG